MKYQVVTKKILNWYDLNKRSLPWRKNVSLQKRQYYTLVSEFMLQQTQVVTVIPYFDRFIKNIPDLRSLAKDTFFRHGKDLLFKSYQLRIFFVIIFSFICTLKIIVSRDRAAFKD